MTLVDTAGWYALLDGGDAHHAKARAFIGSGVARLTHNYILAELVALGEARRLSRRHVLQLVAGLQDTGGTEVVWVTRDMHAAALALLERQLDKAYSLCDAVSFVVMQERGITDALTTDRHFEQAGFRCLLA